MVVTGVGAISALGPDREAFWDALRNGRSGIAPIASIDCETLRFKNGAEVRGFDPAAHFEKRQLDQLDRFAQFGLVAAREAVADAGIAWTPEGRERTAVVTGSAAAGRQTEEMVNVQLLVEKRRSLHPMSIPRNMANAAASQISIEMGLRGPTFTLATACASSNHAIGMAAFLIRHGLADAALAGGSEAGFFPVHLKGWEAIRAVAPDTCRPFCADRKGMILGEGGAILVLEERDAALARGARVYAEIVGFGMTADADHLTAPSGDGAVRAMRAALDDASLAPEQVDHINAHGTGTQANDVMEAAAIRTVFGAHADRILVSATKSMHGHALGASSALEAVATVLALHHGVVPPTANFTTPDPACDLDVVPNTARTAPVQVALSNSFAFGGLNAVLAFRRPD